MKMKRTFLYRACATALAIGATAITMLPAATHAQLVVWSASSFTNDPVGSYGAVVDFAGDENVTTSIVSPGEGGGSSQAWEIAFNPDPGFINFQTDSAVYPASGNTNAFLANYILSFDMQVSGTKSVSPVGGIQVSIFANQSGPSGYAVFGPNLLLPNTDTNVFVAGAGYQHYSIPLSSFKNNSISIATATSFSVGIGYVGSPAGFASAVTFDIANLQITMLTSNVAPPPHPKLTVLPAKPGLRIFQKASDATYTQEGIGTVDLNQSWVGATPSAPRSYAITFADFDTVANYTMNVQLCPGGNPDSPYSVYFSANDLIWTITSGGGASGFTTAVAFKTNSPANAHGSETNVVLATMSTTSTNGRGTWTLTFTTDTNGTVTAPDGTTGSFVLDPAAAAQFADPLTVFFGTSAGANGGYGQFTDISRIAITNVSGMNENDNFTKDDVLDITLWDPNFSRDNPAYGNDAGSVILVSSNTPSYWVNWPIPDDGYGLGTKASLNGGTNVWFTPSYYGGGTVTNTTPSLMGLSLKWTLIPGACLPTVEGTMGGTPSKTGFFRLSNPAPIQ
jgi:hypothetical protein